MKYILRTILCLTAVTLSVTSCTKYANGEGEGHPDELPVTITVSPARTRSGDETDKKHFGDPQDYTVKTLRVLGFRSGDGTLSFNEVVSFDVESGSGHNKAYEGTINARTGKFTIAFIANEQADSTLMSRLEGLEVNKSSVNDLSKMSFSTSSLAWEAANSNLVPMAEIYNGVYIYDTNKLQYEDLTVDGTVWEVAMTRLAVRVDLTLDIKSEQQEGFDAALLNSVFANRYFVNFSNAPSEIFIFKNNTSSKNPVEILCEAVHNNDAYTEAPGNISYPGGENYARITFPRLLLPETYFSPENDQARAISLTAYLGDELKEFKAPLGYDVGSDYTLPRNLYFEVQASIHEKQPEGRDLELTLSVKEWFTGADLNLDLNRSYKIFVDKADVGIPRQGGSFNVEVQTDYPANWTALLSDKAEPDHPQSNTPGWVSTSTSMPAQGNRTLAFNYSTNTTGNERKAYLHIRVGRFHRVVAITQNAVSNNGLKTTGRLVANHDLPGTYDWAAAMGIPDEYNSKDFYTTYPGGTWINLTYTPSRPSGCNAYYETTSDLGKWRLPTRHEMEFEIAYMEFDVHGGSNFSGHATYWVTDEYGYDAYAMEVSSLGPLGTTSQKNSLYKVRCVRAR